MKKRLTSVVLSSLKPKPTPYYVADEQQPGLRVRIAPTGVLTWNVAFRIKGGGSTKSVSLGVCDPTGRQGLSLAEARERAAELLKAARQSRDLIAEEAARRQADEERLSVGQLINRYAKAIMSPSRKGGPLRSALEIERRLRRALGSKLDKPADSLRRSEISELLDETAETRPREAEKRRQVIGAMYRWGIAKGYCTNDPTAGTETYGRGDPRDRVLSPDEIRAVWKWLDAGADRMPPDCVSVLKLQLCTGARVGEIAGMDASELHQDGDRLVWVLPASRSKNKNERRTPLVGRARVIVKEALSRRTRGALFKTILSDRPLAATDIGNALDARKLPCADFTTHDLRRTVVSGMDELGIALDTIAAVVGHQRGTRATRTLIRHYSRPRLDERVEIALTAWDNRLSEILNDGHAQSNLLKLHA